MAGFDWGAGLYYQENSTAGPELSCNHFLPSSLPRPLPLFLSSLVTFSGCLANRLLKLAPPPSLHEALLWPLCTHDPAGEPSLKNQHRENIKKGPLCLL